jgi:predicted anti-sigma-YlaC factor YlaD
MLDGEATTADAASSAPHIFGCGRCRQFAAAVADIAHILRAHRVDRESRGRHIDRLK